MAPMEVRSRLRAAKCKKLVKVFAARLFSHVGLVSLVIGYSIVGALTFEALEADHEVSKRRWVYKQRQSCVEDVWQITEKLNVLYRPNWTALVGERLRRFEQDVVLAVKNEGYDGKDARATDKQWSFSGALLYSVTVITTIGYGNISPKTDNGKVVTILYALIGIPLTLLCLANIGDFFAHAFKFAYSQVCCFFCRQNTQRPPSGSTKRPATATATATADDHVTQETATDGITSSSNSARRVPIWLVLTIVASYIGMGAAIFSFWEKWSPLNGAYFCFITLSTIGFGDLVPGTTNFNTETQAGQAKLILCCFYLMLGLAIIAMAFNLVQEEVVDKCKNIARNMGIINDTNCHM